MKTSFNSQLIKSALIIVISFCSFGFSSCEKENLDDLKVKIDAPTAVDDVNQVDKDSVISIRDPRWGECNGRDCAATWDHLDQKALNNDSGSTGTTDGEEFTLPSMVDGTPDRAVRKGNKKTSY